MFDRVEPDGSSFNRRADGCGHILDLEGFHEAQHLDKLAFALLAHAGLEKTPQCRKRLWQLPVGERSAWSADKAT